MLAQRRRAPDHWFCLRWQRLCGLPRRIGLIAAALALAETGPGGPSVDSALGSEMHGSKWAALALLLGALGAAGAHAAAGSAPAPEPAPASAPAPAPDGSAPEA